MKRTSFTQFTIMVEFMERCGVTSKMLQKKAAKLRNSMRGTGGGPALKICLEQRIMGIIGKQAATGMHANRFCPVDEDWNMPGTSEDPIIISTQDLAPPMPSPPATTPEPHWTPPPPKKRKTTKTSTAANTFIQCERERDEKYIALERERIRQRDTELQLQAPWLEICKEILK
ncbi:hypothetical protein ABMA28_009747 [Loxostege sticticalis]|uniref:Uncharacterized protein n=1 Tax=Loxostege sticticalis TaxID=481309 RepID=A0ABD0SBV2_LOXSC